MQAIFSAVSLSPQITYPNRSPAIAKSLVKDLKMMTFSLRNRSADNSSSLPVKPIKLSSQNRNVSVSTHFSAILSRSLGAITLPVGLFGEHRKIISYPPISDRISSVSSKSFSSESRYSSALQPFSSSAFLYSLNEGETISALCGFKAETVR